MITIKDIAKEANVAISTVSNILNNPNSKVKASQATRQRVLDIAAKHNYTPSALGRALRHGKSDSIAILGNMALYDQQVVLALAGIEEVMKEAKYNLLFINSELEDCLDILLSQHVCGVIIIDKINENNRETFAKIAKVLPTIKVFANANIENINSVYTNPQDTVKFAIDCLIEHNHQKVMILGNRFKTHEVVQEYYANNLLDYNEDYIYPELRSFEDGKEALTILRAKKLDVTAIIAYNDNNAAGIIYEAMKQGIKIPEDISIISVGNLEIAEKIYPNISTVAVNQKSQGIYGAKLLLDKIAKKAINNISLTPNLILRDSIKKINK